MLLPRRTYYYYDEEACCYRKVTPSLRERVGYWVAQGLLAVFLAGVIFFLTDYFTGTPQEHELLTENRVLKEQLLRTEKQLDALSGQLEQLATTDQKLYRTLLNAEPIPDDIRKVGVGGANTHPEFDKLRPETGNILRRTAEKLDELERKLYVQQASYEELLALASRHEEALRELPAIIPANGPVVSGFGRRFHPVYKAFRMHQGIDILVNTGTPVVAAADGIVIFAGRSPGYGYNVRIKHPASGYITLYAHLSSFAKGLRKGKRVKRGEIIGKSGRSGVVSGPHLHYEVRDARTNRPINPITFFAPGMTPEAYQKLVHTAESATISLD